MEQQPFGLHLDNKRYVSLGIYYFTATWSK
jgi:hypothetical protein